MNDYIRIGIDASNLRGGGGLTHLQQLLSAANPEVHEFQKICVWAGKQTLSLLPSFSPYINLVHESELDKDIITRFKWRQWRLPLLIKKSVDLLFIPGGLSGPSVVPWVTMSRNMLPFEFKEKARYRFSRERLRLEALHWVQSRAFMNADGVIFLTQYAKSEVCRQLRHLPKRLAVVPHGIDMRFLRLNNDLNLRDIKCARPFRLLYVSTVNEYKHQWNVAEAVAQLRKKGYNLSLQLIGKGYEPALSRLHQCISRLDPSNEWLTYLGFVPFEQLHEYYHAADAFVFASSCENMPNILLEAMASELPIACSNRGPMPEILGKAGVYFDPEISESIMQAIHDLLKDPQHRFMMAIEAKKRVQQYSWERCANETFLFLREVYKSCFTPKSGVTS